MLGYHYVNIIASITAIWRNGQGWIKLVCYSVITNAAFIFIGILDKEVQNSNSIDIKWELAHISLINLTNVFLCSIHYLPYHYQVGRGHFASVVSSPPCLTTHRQHNYLLLFSVRPKMITLKYSKWIVIYMFMITEKQKSIMLLRQ